MLKLVRASVMGVLTAVVLLPGPAGADEIEAEEVIVSEEPPPPAAPAAEPAPDKTGAFFGVGVTYSLSRFPGLPTTTGGDYDDALGFNLRGGYRFLDFLAVEGVFEYGNEFEANGSFPDPSFPDRTATLSSDISTIGFWTNAKAILPLGAFEPYLSGGVGLLYASELAIAEVWDSVGGASEPMKAKVSDSEGPVVFAGRVAGGIDYALTEHAGLFAEASYALPTGDLSDYNYIGIHLGARLTF